MKKELGLPERAIKDSIVGTSRWSVQHEIVFMHDGKFWSTEYQCGATEQQDESPWEHDELIECVEVELVEKTVKVWEAKQ